MKKRILMLCVVMTMAFLLTACGNDRLNGATAPETSDSPVSTDAGNNTQNNATDEPAASASPESSDNANDTGDELKDDAKDIGNDLEEGADDVGNALTGDDATENR